MNQTTLIVGQNPLSKRQLGQTGPHCGQITLLEWKNAIDGKAETQNTQSNAFPHSLG
ncbi:MAG: hypothetical protein ACI8Q6_003977 [Granulosicoccus sp.]